MERCRVAREGGEREGTKGQDERQKISPEWTNTKHKQALKSKHKRNGKKLKIGGFLE